MEAVLRFIEDLSFDDQHLWAVYEDKKIQWQVQWIRKNQPNYWIFTKQSDLSSTQLPTAQVIPFLNSQNIHHRQFQEAIVESILTMSCFAETFQRNARILLGDEMVERAIEQFDEFSEKLLEMTNRETSQSRPELKVMKE